MKTDYPAQHSDIALLRQHLRTEVRQRRRALTPQQQQQAAHQAAQQVAGHPRIQAAHSVAIFLSFDGELPTRPTIERLWSLGKRVVLPVLHPFSPGHLLFLDYQPETILSPNRLRIPEPPLDVRHILPLHQLDVILTPLVAFDDSGQRLGMGGGFYDRTLAHWREHGPYPIGLAHDCQQVACIPAEQWDVPLPEIITPGKVWRW
ncbi:5-formyltetrahydrofolate cyclo-ligase [Chimaeribacter californicus]|uniref:5-formyltetrahydrofolate cyclo-ligase n=1 Tax=Chimaeribacter californicus TaxID=2060067 RepID=A0A2N5DVW2_9GAMM|nr:5-formyltetrahydrofolate cyclo-ligase [Chimaeribacter californicus]PLR31258.1 5-formyltetrahydrofolate cyclo-ligase [Chimaeribacter californicus]